MEQIEVVAVYVTETGETMPEIRSKMLNKNGIKRY